MLAKLVVIVGVVAGRVVKVKSAPELFPVALVATVLK